ncbi:MAG: peptidoglycan-binding protein [Desulfobulbaceae bacterium]|nr:peptidoglycan-binding protein [Desulfobulbaceae bacterium]
MLHNIFSVIRTAKKLSLILPMLLSISGIATAGADTLDELVAQWRTSDYQGVMPRLIEYRLGPYGKNVQVDYMIATSLCRLPGQAELGRKYFQRILSAYELNRTNREQIEREYQLCQGTASTIEQPSLVAFNIGHSDVGVRGKTFYWLDQQNGPLGGDPIRSLRDIDAAELRSRLFLSGQQAGAITKVAQLAGPGFTVEASGNFVIASSSGQSREELQEIGGYLDFVANFFHDEFGMPLPKYLVTIYLTPETWQLRRLAERVHGLDISDGSIGYSFRDDFSITGVVRGAHTGTLKHELFHLMVRSNFGDIPPWLDEGMASLYEVSRREGPRVYGLQNWREDVLRRFWDMRPPLVHLVQMDWKHFDAAEQKREQQAANHATARYFILFLQEQGKLAQVYQAFQQRGVENQSENPGQDSVNLVETTLRTSITALDDMFADWFSGLQRPLNREAVESMQRRLNKLGYNAGIVDGLWGQNTRNALRAFQRSEGLTPTGQADITTQELLGARAGE